MMLVRLIAALHIKPFVTKAATPTRRASLIDDANTSTSQPSPYQLPCSTALTLYSHFSVTAN
jgi:hypothetical protein